MSWLPMDPAVYLLRKSGSPPHSDAEREDPWRHLQNLLVDIHKGFTRHSVFEKLRASGLVQVMADVLLAFEATMSTPAFKLRYQRNRASVRVLLCQELEHCI